MQIDIIFNFKYNNSLDRSALWTLNCSSCGFSISFASLGRFYDFERSPLCAGTGDDPKGHAGD